VEALKNISQPKIITELRQFLGMAQQLSQFSAKLSKVAEPLRDYSAPKTIFFGRTNIQQHSTKLKQDLLLNNISTLYDVTRKTKSKQMAAY